MEESIRKVIDVKDDRLMEVYLSMTKAVDVVTALYGEVTMTSVVEETLQMLPKRYGLEDVENAYMILHRHRLI